MYISKPWKKSKVSSIIPYSESDYEGEFNLLKAERESLVKALIKNQSYNQTCFDLKTSKSSLLRKLKLHKIVATEWLDVQIYKR